MLVISHLYKRFGRREVVSDVSLNVHRGEVVGLLGPNGAGKTTAFNMVAGLIKPCKGSICFAGRDINGAPLWQRVRWGIGYLPQEATVFRNLSTFDNLLLALQDRLPQQQAVICCQQVLSRFGLTSVGHTLASMLSGGERRRLEMARSLILEPQILLLDEPFAGVDPIHVSQLGQFIQQLAQAGTGILLTDHNVRDTLKICDRIYLLHQGKVVVSGSPATILTSDAAQRMYLGFDFKL